MPQVLTCWKDIAAYLGKGVRTVQRWEHTLGFPVRRPDGAGRGIVFAIPAELDEWVRAHPQSRATVHPQEANRAAAGKNNSNAA